MKFTVAFIVASDPLFWLDDIATLTKEELPKSPSFCVSAGIIIEETESILTIGEVFSKELNFSHPIIITDRYRFVSVIMKRNITFRKDIEVEIDDKELIKILQKEYGMFKEVKVE